MESGLIKFQIKTTPKWVEQGKGDKMSTTPKFCINWVFSTKHRTPALKKQNRNRLYTFIWGIPKNNNNCHLYPINGVEDHLHIFPEFNGWQEGYGGFTYSYDAKDRLIDYVKNQEEHHKTVTFKQEYKALLEEHGIEFYEKYVPWFNPLRGYFWWFFYPGLHPGLFMFNPFRIGLLILF